MLILSPEDTPRGLMVAYLTSSLALILTFAPQAEWLLH